MWVSNSFGSFWNVWKIKVLFSKWSEARKWASTIYCMRRFESQILICVKRSTKILFCPVAQPSSRVSSFFVITHRVQNYWKTGFGDRLLHELRKPSPKDTKIRISAPQERIYSTWIGGSILGDIFWLPLMFLNFIYTASLGNFKRIWVTKKEWESEGARALHRKTMWIWQKFSKHFFVFFQVDRNC